MNARMSQGWKVQMPSDDRADYVAYHEDYRAISFRCTVAVDGSMFIYIGEPSRWANDYPWAALRRDEIVTRVAQAITAPGRVADIHDERGYILVRKQSQ